MGVRVRFAGAFIPGQGRRRPRAQRGAACWPPAGTRSDTASPSASPSASASTPSSTPSATPSATPTPTPKPVKPSSNFDKVTVSGDYGEQPKVKVDEPWAIDKTRTEVLDASNGAVVKENQTVEVNYYGVERA